MKKVAYWASLVFVATLPFEGLITLGSFGSLARNVGVVAAMLWLVKVAGDRSLRAPNGLHIVMMAMLAWVGMSMNWSANPSQSRSTLLTMIMLFILIYMIWDLVDSRRRLMAVIQAFVLGAAVPVYLVIEARISTSDAGARLTAASFHPNDLAMVLSLAIPLAGHLAFRGNSGISVKVMNFVMVPLSIFAALMTGSRSGLVAVIIGAGYVLTLILRSVPPARSVFLVLVLLFPALLLPAVADRLVERLLGTGEALTTGLNGRTEIWTDALVIFNERPLIGIGAGAFEDHTIAVQPPHNIFVSYGAELGVVGILLLSTLLVVVLVKALEAPPEMRVLWLVVLMAWGANAVFHNIEHRKQTWLIFALVAVASELPELATLNERRAEGRAPARAHV